MNRRPPDPKSGALPSALLLHIAGLSRLPSIARPIACSTPIEKVSKALIFILWLCGSIDLCPAVCFWKPVADLTPFVLTLTGACENGKVNSPLDAAYNPTAQRLFCLLPFPVVGGIRFGVSPGGLVIVLLGFADPCLFFLPGQIFRLLAMVRTGNIPIRAALAGAAAGVSHSCYHKFTLTMAPAGVEPALLRIPLRRIAAGNMANPAGGLCLLSAVDFLGEEIVWQLTNCHGGRGRIRTGSLRLCRPLHTYALLRPYCAPPQRGAIQLSDSRSERR